MHDSDYVMACYTVIIYVANNIKKLHIMFDLNSGYIHNFYHDNQESIDDLFCQWIKPLLKYIDNFELIKEWKQIFDAAAYENN